MDLYRALQADANDVLARCVTPDLQVSRVLLGINWTALQTEPIAAEPTVAEQSAAIGLAFSPQDVPRTLPWPGTLCRRPARELLSWLERWNPAEAAVGLAALNAVLNHSASLRETALPLTGAAPSHLRVFEHFTAQVTGARIVVIGRYPGLDELWRGIPYQCLERKPQADDLPDTAAEFCLPQADWVFITASSIANKSVLRLLQLSRNARVVLMGPSLPWWPRWHEFGVDYLAGVRITDPSALWQVVAEGGGTRLFDTAVQYCLHAF